MNCPTAPCNPACGGDPCLPECEGSGFECDPCLIDDEGDPLTACLYNVGEFCAPEACPPECLEECEPDETWSWSADPPGAVIWRYAEQWHPNPPPDGASCVEVRFVAPGEVTISASNGCCTWEKTVEVAPSAEGLIITTIEDNPNWPGPRPAGMETRLGYPAGANPSDMQILFDVVMNIPGGLVDKLNQMAQGAYGFSILTPTAGQLADATEADKQWLTLAMLKRSVNPVPPASLTHQSLLQNFLPGGEWRLLNRLVACAWVEDGAFTGINHTEWHLIGPTKFRLVGQVQFTLTSGLQITVDFNPSLVIVLWVNTADPGDENGMIDGGEPGDSFIMHRTAGRIGRELEPYEHALIPKRAAPFFSPLVIEVDGDLLAVSGEGSQNEDLRWPTTRIYKWEETAQGSGTFHFNQQDEEVQPQVATPFEWIDLFGTPWP